MKESTKDKIVRIGFAGLVGTLLTATALTGKSEQDRALSGPIQRDLSSLNSARLGSNPREVIYDSDGNGTIDTSRTYLVGPSGGLFKYDQPLSE